MTDRLPLAGKLIAFFHHSADLYGSDKVLLELVVAVQKLGGRCVVVLPHSGLLTNELQARGIEFYARHVLKLDRGRFSLRGILTLLWEAITAVPTYDRLFANRRVDLVHSNTVAVLGGALWARRRGIPHLWHVHEIVEHPQLVANAFRLLVAAFADRIVCNSSATRDWLVHERRKLANKTRVVQNGVKVPPVPDLSTVERLRHHFLRGQTRHAIGLVGRINRWKGQSLLIDAAELLHKRGIDDFSVAFVGSASEGQEHFVEGLKKRIAASPLHDRMIVHEYTMDIWSVYAALDIVCVPSIEPEPFGLVAIEAMAMGKPVVASGAGGLNEIVVDGTTGVTFPLRDPESLAIGIETLLRNADMRHSMGQAGRERVRTNFCVDRMIRGILENWQQTMEEPA